jgi:hypothetical protein
MRAIDFVVDTGGNLFFDYLPNLADAAIKDVRNFFECVNVFLFKKLPDFSCDIYRLFIRITCRNVYLREAARGARLQFSSRGGSLPCFLSLDLI